MKNYYRPHDHAYRSLFLDYISVRIFVPRSYLKNV